MISVSRSARILWERFSIVTFPFPGSGCDLITEQGVRIEVRSGGKFLQSIDYILKKRPFAEIVVMWREEIAYILPKNLVMKLRRRMPKGHFPYYLFRERWDYITKLEEERKSNERGIEEREAEDGKLLSISKASGND